MAKESKEKKGTISNIFITLFLITSLITSGALVYGIFLYEGIESLIRYIIMGLLILNDIRLLFKARKIIKGKAKKKPISSEPRSLTPAAKREVEEYEKIYG